MLLDQLKEMLWYVRELKFEETPDYTRLHRQLGEVATKQGLGLDGAFDWEEDLKLHKTHRKASMKACEEAKHKSPLVPAVAAHPAKLGEAKKDLSAT